MAKLTVYHGGYQPVKVPEIRIGRNTKDLNSGLLLHDNQRTGGTMVQKISHKDCFHLRCAAELVFKDKRVQRDDG